MTEHVLLRRVHRPVPSSSVPTSSAPTSSGALPRGVTDILASGGRPLPTAVRADVEARFAAVVPTLVPAPTTVHRAGLSRPGDPVETQADQIADQVTTTRPAAGRAGFDFSAVRIHTDARAAASAAALNATAYSVGPHIVFGEGRYDPGSAAGRRLLAHELTHVVQQPRVGPVVHRQVKSMSDEQRVLHELDDTFTQKGIAYAEEVSFVVLDAAGRPTLKADGTPLGGRADRAWQHPQSGKVCLLECKGTAASARTHNQTEYVPEFERGAGWEIRGSQGGNLGLSKGVKGSTADEGFALVHSGNLKEFLGKSLGKFPNLPGRALRFVTVDANGNRSVKFFDSPEELAQFQRARGASTPGVIEPQPPAPATAPAEPTPHGTATAKPPSRGGGVVRRIPGLLGLGFLALDVYTAYQELDALSKGEDLHPNGYYDHGPGGRVITDFRKLPNGFASPCISAPMGHGAGFYEKRHGDVYKDGKLLHIMQDGELVSGGA